MLENYMYLCFYVTYQTEIENINNTIQQNETMKRRFSKTKRKLQILWTNYTTNILSVPKRLYLKFPTLLLIGWLFANRVSKIFARIAFGLFNYRAFSEQSIFGEYPGE